MSNPQEPPPFSSVPPPPNFPSGPPPPFTAGPPPVGPSGSISVSLQGFIQNAISVISRPAAASFDAVQGAAEWQTLLLAVGAVAVIEGIVSMIVGFIGGHPATAIFGLIFGIIFALAGFFIGAGILYLLAKIFGGTGDFLHHSYVLALVSVPLGVVDAILGVIPILGLLVSLAVGVYAIYLAILAMSSVHRLTTGKAAAVVLIPVGIAVVLSICVAVLAAAALVATHR